MTNQDQSRPIKISQDQSRLILITLFIAFWIILATLFLPFELVWQPLKESSSVFVKKFCCYIPTLILQLEAKFVFVEYLKKKTLVPTYLIHSVLKIEYLQKN